MSDVVSGTEGGNGLTSSPKANGQVASPSSASAGASATQGTAATSAATKKKFGKNLNKLVKKPASSTAPQSASGSGTVTSSSFIAKKNEGASSTGGGLLLLSTKRSSTTASNINSVGGSSASNLSGVASLSASSKQIPVTTAASVAATGSTSSALLAKLSGGMALSAKGAAAHKAATATLTNTATSSTSSTSSYPKAAGPRPLNTPSLKSLVGASSVGDAATTGPTGTAGWKKPAPQVAPSSMFGSDDKKREEEKKKLEETADPSADANTRTSKVWKLGNAHADAASLLLPKGAPKKESGRLPSSSFGSRDHSARQRTGEHFRTSSAVASDPKDKMSPPSSRFSLLERTKEVDETASGDGSGTSSALSRIAAIREARRRQSSAPKEEARSTIPVEQSTSQTSSRSEVPGNDKSDGERDSPSARNACEEPNAPRSRTCDEPPAVILKKDPQAVKESPKKVPIEPPSTKTTTKKPQISLELLNSKPSSRKSNIPESSLTHLGNGDHTLPGKASSGREESVASTGGEKQARSDIPGRTYSSLLGGSNKVKVELESCDTGRNSDILSIEEKRLGPPMRIIKRRLHNPSDDEGQSTAVNGTNKGQRAFFEKGSHDQNHSLDRRLSADVDTGTVGKPASKAAVNRDTVATLPNRETATIASREVGAVSNRDAGNHCSTNLATIHLSSYDDKNRGESSTTSPRMLFDPKSGSLVEASQHALDQSSAEAVAKGSKAGGRTFNKRSKGNGRESECDAGRDRERDGGRDRERPEGVRERGQGSNRADDRASGNKWNSNKTEASDRDGVAGRNRRSGRNVKEESSSLEQNAPASGSKYNNNARTKANRRSNDSDVVDSVDSEKRLVSSKKSPSNRCGGSSSTASPLKQQKSQPRPPGSTRGLDSQRNREDRDSSEDVEGEKRREGKGGRNTFGQIPNQTDSTKSRPSRAFSRDISKNNRVSRGPPAKGNTEIRNSRARALRGQTEGTGGSYSHRDGASSGRRIPGGGRPHGGRDNGRGSPSEFNGGYNSSRRSPQLQSSTGYASFNSRHGHHHARPVDGTTHSTREKTPIPPLLDASPPIVFDSGGVSLPEVAPQFNDDDFKVITDITDSIPADLSRDSSSVDRANSLNAGPAATIGTNAWHSSEATLAFAAVAAAHTQAKPEHREFSRGNADDGDDDTDDFLNVPFLGGLGFDPTSDMDAVISSPSRQGHDGDARVPSALESLSLGAGASAKSNPFATLGTPAGQFLGSSAWGGGRTLHDMMSSSKTASGDPGTSKGGSGLNLNWNSILSGGAERSSLSEGPSPSRSNGWVASTIGMSALESDVGMQADSSKK